MKKEKLQKTARLLQEQAIELSKSPESWMEFLKSASFLSKYEFPNQVLIYAQRPEAKAVANIDIWNKAFGRRVKRGTKGIAILQNSGQGLELNHVFDISDTHETEYTKKEANVWSYNREIHKDAFQKVARKYGYKGESVSEKEILKEIIKSQVADILPIITDKLESKKENSLLEELNRPRIRKTLREMLSNTIEYSVLSRMGLSSNTSPEDFISISSFSTLKTITLLGTESNEITREFLSELQREIKSLEKEKNLDKSLAKNIQSRYILTKGVLGSENASEELTDIKSEGASEDENRLQGSKRISDTEFGDGEESTSRQVRENERALSYGKRQEHLQLSDNKRGTTGAFGESGRGSISDDGNSSGANDGANGSKRGDESQRPDGMGAASEQHQSDGRRESYERADIQLEGLKAQLPTEEEQEESIIEYTETKSSKLSISQEDIDYVLQKGSNFVRGKHRIMDFYSTEPTNKEASRFLRKEYGVGGSSRALKDAERAYQEHDGRGIHIKLGDLLAPDDEVFLSWDDVAKRVRELIQLNRFMNQREKESYDEYKSEMAKAAAEELTRNLGKREEHIFSYEVGKTVYIGADEYTISSVHEDSIELRNTNFPLLSKELNKKEFEEKAWENGLNIDLFQKNQSKADEREDTVVLSDKVESSEKFDIGYGSLGNGIAVWNKNSIVDGDYEKVAHISEEHEVKFYRQDLPKEVQEKIENMAKGTNSELPIEKSKSEEEPKAKVEEVETTATVKREKHNFKITDDSLGVASNSTKLGWNIEAIKTLKSIEKEDRLADESEQAVLSRYVGWGGLSKVFDEREPNSKRDELKSLLTDEEYAKARESTLNAHYTSPEIIKAMYGALENLGFEKGNILEPSCGVGNFLGLLPDSMKESRLYGVELDEISGRIAKQLYQKSSIAVEGYEKTSLPDSFFDVAIGNVPFGQYKVNDSKYNKYNFMIHDYFFGKTLDKIRPGGVIAFITSKGTMDKANPSFRKYMAQRADLLGAIRLPNTAFKGNAGTEATSDILFFQKRDRASEIEPEWLNVSENEDGIKINQYFIDNPDMILGKMEMKTGQFGMESTCVPDTDTSLESQLSRAIGNIHGALKPIEIEYDDTSSESILPADPALRNYSYTIIDGEVYFRENSIIVLQDKGEKAKERIKGMLDIRDCIRKLIEYQMEDCPDETIVAERNRLGLLYDEYTKKYGLLNSRGNSLAFRDDSSYPLLCSLEILTPEKELLRKADIFTKRTARKYKAPTRVDSSVEALTVSLSEKARVDLDYMESLTGYDKEKIVSELEGIIFRNPKKSTGTDIESGVYETADEYLSGNVREKLRYAKGICESGHELSELYSSNIAALEKVQPKDLLASEISVRLGATWIPKEMIRNFMFETIDTPMYMRSHIDLNYSDHTATWNVQGKSVDGNNIKANMTYGTSRMNAYYILESTLNLKDVRIFDIIEDERVLNKKETALAQQRQELIKEAFNSWIWKDPKRRETLTKLYNERFNSIRPRQYDGQHLTFPGMNPEITLRKHQLDAVAHTLYGGNTLMAHVVGAGKTYSMVAASMESKRLGLCNKSLFVVPNHLTEQWGNDFLQLYPGANILIATKKDFEPKNRKKFCGRIATGDYDAVIIGHTQFEKIPMSIERQVLELNRQLNDITEGIEEVQRDGGDSFSVKQMERTRKSIKEKLERLNDQERKDDVVTFEELGVDRIFVDEAHYYKNLFLVTKMRNVAGISQTEAMKSSDLFMKCRYLDEVTDRKGVIFATGTPISNSMTEMYTMQRYLQYDTLKERNLQHFDCWASTFGETVTAIELAPEGTGYRAKTRFAKFYSLPELMNMFREVADIQTADMLNLPVPEAEFNNVAIKPSEHQKEIVSSLAERAESVRNAVVDPTVDNMLKITNDGRKLALDQRLINEILPDETEGKVSTCAANVFNIWDETRDKKSTQLVFCDLSTPTGKGSQSFNVYDDLKRKLIESGLPEKEISFIHDAKTETQKDNLFSKVKSGEVRVLIGSTLKMGAGTNVQNKLIALHDLDCPWRPSDLEQRLGRMVRQGNENDKVKVFRYVTENTFDAYLYQLVENKQKFISQIMTSKSPVRSAEDIDEAALSYAEVKALATGNPYIKEKMDLDVQVSKLKLLKANYLSQKYTFEDNVMKHYPKEISRLSERIKGFESDISVVAKNTSSDEKYFYPMELDGVVYDEKEAAGKALLESCKGSKGREPRKVGSYRGFDIEIEFDSFTSQFNAHLKNSLTHKVALGGDVFGNITRIDNALEGLEPKLEHTKNQLEFTEGQLEKAKLELKKPFSQESELTLKSGRLAELDALLNMDNGEQPGDDHKIEEAKNLITEFLIDEYGEEVEPDMYDTEAIGIAYTTTGDDEHEIQVEADLKNYSMNKYIDGVLIEENKYDSLDKFIDCELKCLNFDELISVSDKDIERARNIKDNLENQRSGGRSM